MTSQSYYLPPRRAGPRQAWPSSRPTRQRSDVAQRLGRHVLRYAASRFLETESRSEGQSPRGVRQSQQCQGSSTEGVVMDILVGQLLEEVIQYLIRHNFFRRGRATSRASSTRDVDRHQGEGPHSQSSYEQRSRHRRQRRTDLMMVSLDRLSTELELTNDALLRVIRNGSTQNESLLANAGDLRRAIIRCVARIESVRRHHRRNSGRGSSARGDSRLLSRSSSQLHSQSL